MFANCKNITNINYINFHKSNFKNSKININGMFSRCSSLKVLPDISTWKEKNLANISSLFKGCSSLIS